MWAARTGEVEEERLLRLLRRVLRDQTARHLRVCPAQRMQGTCVTNRMLDTRNQQPERTHRALCCRWLSSR